MASSAVLSPDFFDLQFDSTPLVVAVDADTVLGRQLLFKGDRCRALALRVWSRCVCPFAEPDQSVRQEDEPSTVRFGRTGTEAALVHAALEDVDGDGNDDPVLLFWIRDAEIECGDTSASLIGETTNGEAIHLSDSIKTVGCR